MEERYRLVFRGEVLDGHHPAVVKKKLGESLKVGGERLDALFAGKVVVIRRDADAAEAARYQTAFKKAGARLRLVPLEVEAESAPSEPAPMPPAPQSFNLAPLDEGLLRPIERRRVEAPRIDVEHLSLAAIDVESPRPPALVARPAAVPDWEIAPVGERLSYADAAEVTEAEALVAIRSPEWSIAPAGARLVDARAAPAPAVDLATIDFSLAPEGTRLQDEKPGGPPPPDTSHLSLEEPPSG